MIVGAFARSKDISLITPPVEMVPQGLSYLGVQEAVQQRNDETLQGQSNGEHHFMQPPFSRTRRKMKIAVSHIVMGADPESTIESINRVSILGGVFVCNRK